MNKKTIVTGSIVTGAAVLGMFTFATLQGIEYIENVVAEQDTAAIVDESVMDEDKTEAVEESEEKLHIQTPVLHPAGHGFIIWYESAEDEIIDEDITNVSGFEVSPDGDVEFVDGEPEDETIYNEIVEAIQRKHKQDSRAIHFMEGYMNEDLTEGTMQYASSEQIMGEVSFTVKSNGEIVVDESDWETLPETDERTQKDFEATAERMVRSWKKVDELENNE